MILNKRIKELVNKYIVEIFHEEALDLASIWWEVLMTTYSINVEPIYTFNNATMAKILACYYILRLNERSKGSISQGSSLDMGHIKITGVNATEGTAVALATKMLAELMPENFAKIEVIQ